MAFNLTLQWVLAHGYILMFAAMLIEGPVITAAASFAVALGYFNLELVFLLSVLGDLVADVVYYLIGYASRMTIIKRWGHYFHLSEQRVNNIERLLQEHSVKTIVVLKLTPFIPTPGFMIVGATRFPLKRFTWICLLTTLPKTVLFMALGYYFGKLFVDHANYFKNANYLLFVGVAAIIGFSIIYKKVTAKVAAKVEKI